MTSPTYGPCRCDTWGRGDVVLHGCWKYALGPRQSPTTGVPWGISAKTPQTGKNVSLATGVCSSMKQQMQGNGSETGTSVHMDLLRIPLFLWNVVLFWCSKKYGVNRTNQPNTEKNASNTNDSFIIAKPGNTWYITIINQNQKPPTLAKPQNKNNSPCLVADTSDLHRAS